METRIIVAQCGKDKDLNIVEPDKHLAEAVYLENQPEGSGWFIPSWCPACEAEFFCRVEDFEYRAKIDAYLASPEFSKITTDIAGAAVYNKIMRQGED